MVPTVTDVSVVIMAHPKRRAWAEGLAEIMGCPVVWDEGKGMWDTGRRALLAGVAAGGTHHLVLQDDTIPSDGLAGLLETLRRPGPTSLYAGASQHTTPAVAACVARGVPWFRYAGLVWGPAVMQPVEHLEPLVAHGDIISSRSYDQRLTAYWRRRKVACWYTVPSLVEHRHGGNPSLKGGPDGRRAITFGSGVGVDWDIEAVVADKDLWSPLVTFQDGHSRVRRVRYGTAIYRRLAANRTFQLDDQSASLVAQLTV